MGSHFFPDRRQSAAVPPPPAPPPPPPQPPVRQTPIQKRPPKHQVSPAQPGIHASFYPSYPQHPQETFSQKRLQFAASSSSAIDDFNVIDGLDGLNAGSRGGNCQQYFDRVASEEWLPRILVSWRTLAMPGFEPAPFRAFCWVTVAWQDLQSS